MKIYLAQINPTVGDLEGNVKLLLAELRRAEEAGAHLFVAPELALTGYPPRDLLDRPGFIRDAEAALDRLAAATGNLHAVIGAVVPAPNAGTITPRCSNGAAVLHQGERVGCHRKALLPSYDVFDEARYFAPGDSPTLLTVNGVVVGLTICEDIWNPPGAPEPTGYPSDPVRDAVDAGAEIIINLSASPYERHKPERRKAVLTSQARTHGVPLVYCNAVGGNDSLIFDGRSLCVNAEGGVIAEGLAFKEDTLLLDYSASTLTLTSEARPEVAPATLEEMLSALTLGVRDYTRKCGFNRAVIGLSGGIDSALTAAIAVRALGPENVIGVTMPSRYSSEGAAGDALDLGERLGIRVDTVPIEPMFNAFLEALQAPFGDLPPDVAEENLQARIRGDLLMAYSNKFGLLLLTTGNKSEMAVGYCTLYGDMCGGLAVLSDVYKTDVYALSRHLNNTTTPPPIPDSTLTKAPSAELRPDQRDEDSLPPYPVLDDLLSGYIDRAESPEELIASGLPRDVVRKITGLVDRNEYKRRQAPPGLRVSPKAFGEGRRLPIAARYRP